MAILIKRYANRKLYNTETSRYITLKGIAELLDEGEEVRVIDKETGEDITQVALSQILVGNQRAKEDPSDTLLTQILSKGGDALYGAIKKSVDEATDGLGEFQDRFRHFVDTADGAIPRGFRPLDPWDERAPGEKRSPFARSGDDDAREESAAGDATDEPGARHEERARWLRMGGLPDLREAIQSAIERSDLRNLRDFPRKRDLDQLNANLERVSETIERLEERLAKLESERER